MNLQDQESVSSQEQTEQQTQTSDTKRQSCWESNSQECPDNVNTLKVLNNVKINASTAKRATETVIEYVDNKNFADLLKAQVIKYDDFVRRADQLANSTGCLLEEQGGLGQFFAKANIKMKLMSDNSVGKVAELMIIGSTMGMIDLGKVLRHTPDVNPDTLKLAKELLLYEEDKIQAMKYHL